MTLSFGHSRTPPRWSGWAAPTQCGWNVTEAHSLYTKGVSEHKGCCQTDHCTEDIVLSSDHHNKTPAAAHSESMLPANGNVSRDPVIHS